MTPLPLGVLISGRGSNLQAIVRAAREGRAAVRVVVVVADRRAPGLDFARQEGIPAYEVHRTGFADRDAFEEALLERLREHGAQAVALAGFLRVLGPRFLRGAPGPVLNIHPSLLPAFPGLRAQAQALEYGVKVAGCTVHFVDEGVDTGPIILQRAVPVLEDDDVESLSRRILAEEHRAYPEALDLLARGRLRVEGRRVHIVPPE